MSNIQNFRTATGAASSGFLRTDRNTQHLQVFGDSKFFGKVTAWLKNPGADGKVESGGVINGNATTKDFFIGALRAEYASLGRGVVDGMVRAVKAGDDRPLSVMVVKQLIADGDRRLEASRHESANDASLRRIVNFLDDDGAERRLLKSGGLTAARLPAGFDRQVNGLVLAMLPARVADQDDATRARLLNPQTETDRQYRAQKIEIIRSELLLPLIDDVVLAGAKVALTAAAAAGTRTDNAAAEQVIGRVLAASPKVTGKAAIFEAIDSWDMAAPDKHTAKLAALRSDETSIAGFTDQYFPKEATRDRATAAPLPLVAPGI